jgi:penicillin G amidase
MVIDFSRLGRTLGLTLGVAAGVAGLGAWAVLRRPLPRNTGETLLPGLRGKLRILRDGSGVPYIYAEHNEDLFRGLGYVHAQDRLWQMELNRRTGHGQLAELFGPVALSSDQFVRTLGFNRIVRREVELLDDETRSFVEAYIGGINSFVEANLSRLPLEFTLLRYTPRPWSAADVLVWPKLMALSLCGNFTNELLHARMLAALGPERFAQLLATYPEHGPITVPEGIAYPAKLGEGALQAAAEAAPFINLGVPQGSNAWVVGPERSATGKPIFASDPHLAISLPLVWYEVHLEGGDFAMAGSTFPGLPAIPVGHNANIAWAPTNSMTDVQDLYIERLDPTGAPRYEWQGGWRELELIREEIVVKGQPEVHLEDVWLTHHGPLIDTISAPEHSPLYSQGEQRTKNEEQRTKNEELRTKNEELRTKSPATSSENSVLSSQFSVLSSQFSVLSSHTALALRWTALDPAPDSLRAALAMGRARNWDEFRAGLAHWLVPAQNFIYADVDGHIGYALSGKHPIRAEGHDGRLPVPGWEGKYEWQGYLPMAALPATLDPDEGFAVTANNRIAGANYRYASQLQGDYLNPYRAGRIRELLQANEQHDLASFGRIQHDLLSLPGLELARLMRDLPLEHPFEQRVRDLLVQWDGELSASCVGGTIYDTLRYYLERQTYAELSELMEAQASLGAFGSIPGNAVLSRAFPTILERIAKASDAERSDPWLGEGCSWNQLLREALTLTINELSTQLGPDPTTWQYGRIHSLTLRHPLGNIPALAPIFNRGPWPMGGDVDTVFMGHVPRQSGAGPVYQAPSVRHLFVVGDWDQSQFSMPAGQSGHPASPHYLDQNEAWRTGGYRRLPWSRKAVEEAAVATLVLVGKAG